MDARKLLVVAIVLTFVTLSLRNRSRSSHTATTITFHPITHPLHPHVHEHIPYFTTYHPIVQHNILPPHPVRADDAQAQYAFTPHTQKQRLPSHMPALRAAPLHQPPHHVMAPWHPQHVAMPQQPQHHVAPLQPHQFGAPEPARHFMSHPQARRLAPRAPAAHFITAAQRQHILAQPLFAASGHLPAQVAVHAGRHALTGYERIPSISGYGISEKTRALFGFFGGASPSKSPRPTRSATPSPKPSRTPRPSPSASPSRKPAPYATRGDCGCGVRGWCWSGCGKHPWSGKGSFGSGEWCWGSYSATNSHRWIRCKSDLDCVCGRMNCAGRCGYF